LLLDRDGKGDGYGERERETEKEVGNIEMDQLQLNYLLLSKYIGAPMPPASLGSPDRIKCALIFRLCFGFFFLFGAPILTAL
jgi:hypothetical protein